MTNKLYGDFDWDNDVDAGDYLVIEAYSVLDPDTYTEIYNDRLLKRYTTALIKRAWGANLSKFEGVQLPGGVQFNGQRILEEAMAEIEKIEEESDPAVTEFELYSDLLEITKQLDEFSSNLNVAMGLTASATKQSQLPDEVYETIRSAIRGLDDARIKMAQAIGQDPAPELAPVR